MPDSVGQALDDADDAVEITADDPSDELAADLVDEGDDDADDDDADDDDADEDDADEDDAVDPDFAVFAYREEGRWYASPLPPSAAHSLESLRHALRQQPGEGFTLALVGALEEYVLVVRSGGGEVRLLLNDVAAATEWPLALDVLDHLGLPEPDEEDLEHVQPVGDLSLLADLGLDAIELGLLCENLDLYADEVAASIAARLGFGEEFEAAVDVDLG
jgi:putative tRNA adenosine deaminase-associated protein